MDSGFFCKANFLVCEVPASAEMFSVRITKQNIIIKTLFLMPILLISHWKEGRSGARIRKSALAGSGFFCKAKFLVCEVPFIYN